MTPPRKHTAADRAKSAHITSLRHAIDRLSEKRAGSSSVTMKLSAQGVFMPEVTIAANEDQAVIDAMVKQAVTAYTALLEAAK